jgi:hypothetical protein
VVTSPKSLNPLRRSSFLLSAGSADFVTAQEPLSCEARLADCRVTTGDDASLLEYFRPRLLYFVLWRLRDRTLAEEIMQDTLTIVLESLRDNRIEDPAKL